MASLCSVAPFSILHKKLSCCFTASSLSRPSSLSRYFAQSSSVNSGTSPIAVKIFIRDGDTPWKRGKNCNYDVVTSVAKEKNDYQGNEDTEELSEATLLWRAIKLPIYSVALVPLTVASAASYFQTGLFSASLYIRLLASSISIITWLNLSNDVYDFDTGADKNKRESVVNMLQSRTGTLVVAYAFLLLGLIGLISVAAEAGNVRSILLLMSAIMCGYAYQVEGDRAFNKFSPLVRIGTETGAEVVKVAVIALYSLVILLGLGRVLPLSSTVFCSLTLPIGIMIINYVKQNHNDNTKIFIAKYLCVRLHTLFGLALSLGLRRGSETFPKPPMLIILCLSAFKCTPSTTSSDSVISWTGLCSIILVAVWVSTSFSSHLACCNGGLRMVLLIALVPPPPSSGKQFSITLCTDGCPNENTFLFREKTMIPISHPVKVQSSLAFLNRPQRLFFINLPRREEDYDLYLGPHRSVSLRKSLVSDSCSSSSPLLPLTFLFLSFEDLEPVKNYP
ncbi:hypothetical protein V2J09_020629 [Rumex salicifolius]